MNCEKFDVKDFSPEAVACRDKVTKNINTAKKLKEEKIKSGEIAATTDDNMVAFVNSNDLYYSTCVTENGSTALDGNTPKRYQYDLSGSTTSYNCATGNTTRYAPMPYAQYVDIFYRGVTNETIF